MVFRPNQNFIPKSFTLGPRLGGASYSRQFLTTTRAPCRRVIFAFVIADMRPCTLRVPNNFALAKAPRNRQARRPASAKLLTIRVHLTGLAPANSPKRNESFDRIVCACDPASAEIVRLNYA
jgi:hypothetical protein